MKIMPESEFFKEIVGLDTEKINPRTTEIDISPTKKILDMINQEDMLVSIAVQKELKYIETAVEHIVDAFKQNGRLFYLGAGTSGRLGVVDASECPPTFGTNPEMVQGIIAGGKEAMFVAQEGAEDLPENGAKEIINKNILPPDIVCGIAASGRTPFVMGALSEAKSRACFTILITTSSRAKLSKMNISADLMICPEVGPEVLAGSTRMKSGTAQKLVLNMLTTASMIRLGKTYSNIMIDLQLTNKKLVERAKKTIMSLCNIDYDSASEYLILSGGHVKTAIVMCKANVNKEKAKLLLKKANGFVKLAISDIV